MKSVEKAFGPKVDKGFALDIRLAISKREATKIVQLKGRVMVLTGGERSEVAVPDVASLAGKEAPGDALKAAGVKIEIVSAGGKNVSYRVEGNADALLDVALIDADGKALETGRGWTRINDSATYELTSMNGELPAKVGLKITLLKDAKLLSVPFDLKDIPLP